MTHPQDTSIKSAAFSVQIITSINDIAATDWDALTDGTPLISHAFLSALGCSLGGKIKITNILKNF